MRFPLGLLFAALMFSFLAAGMFWPRTSEQKAAKRRSKFEIACGVSVLLFAVFLFASAADVRILPAFLPVVLIAGGVLMSAGKALDWVTRSESRDLP